VPVVIHYELKWDMSDQIELVDLHITQMVIQLLQQHHMKTGFRVKKMCLHE